MYLEGEEKNKRGGTERGKKGEGSEEGEECWADIDRSREINQMCVGLLSCRERESSSHRRKLGRRQTKER